MIQVIDNRTGQILNDFPGLPGAVSFCEGVPDLWRYSFLDTERKKYISWAQVEALRTKRGFCAGRVIGGKIVIYK